jgi:hypothetical protein
MRQAPLRLDRSTPLRRTWLLLVLLLPLCAGPLALAAEPPGVPDALAPWVDWVLEDADRRACALAGDGQRLCAWPGPLSLTLDSSGGRFEQHWALAAEDWVPLPGGGALWPEQVVSDAEPVAVVERDGVPSVRLGPGSHRLSGRFSWPRRPRLLPVPAQTGLLALSIDGEAVASPRRDARGLWLGEAAGGEPAAEPDALTLEVMRRIDDDIPLRVRTLLALDVAGQARELQLGPVLLPGGIALAVDSPLPARLLDGDDAGLLQIQVRPGRWELTIDSHHPGPVTALSLSAREPPWPAREVWAFAARPQLRQVELTGADALDPRQTRLPAAWQQLPAYLLRPGETLTLTELRRGALGVDRVQLQRDLWLDFDAKAFSLRDRLSGRLEQRWRIDAEPVLQLGQVQVDGEPRFITTLDSGDGQGADAPALAGVEVRQGRLDLLADARIEHGPVGFAVDLPAAGWALPLDAISTRLYLPPGWDLFAAGGVDNLPDSWLARWTLLDIFLVLVLTLAIGRLWGWPWGLLGLVTLVLIWPEPGAPRWIWLHILVAAALLRVLPVDADRSGFPALRRLLQLYYRAALVVLALIALPFLVTQVRDGLFPQLDHRGGGGGAWVSGAARPSAAEPFADAVPAEVSSEGARAAGKGLSASARATSTAPPPAAAPAGKPLPTLDPNARVQTGAGVPNWGWRSFTLAWSGPVAAEHQVRLWLISPALGLALALLRLLLLVLLGLRLADLLPLPKPPAGAAGLLLLGVALSLLPVTDGLAQGAAPTVGPPAAATDAASPAAATPRQAPPLGTASAAAFPPQALLDTLRERLLAPPDCLPRCAEIARARIEVDAEVLRLSLVVDAMEPVALPVPGSAEGWAPATLTLNGTPLDALRRTADGTLLAPVPAGRHLLVLAAPLPASGEVDIPLPLRPHQVEARLQPPWQLEGVAADGRPGDQLRLLRPRVERIIGAPDADAAGVLPPLLRVERTLRFGLDWTVETRVERLSPAASPVSLRVPLLPGEAVNTPGLQVDDGRLLVSLPPGRTAINWSSTLAPVDRLTLAAADDSRLTEVWRLEVSPLWHLAWDGIDPVQNLSDVDRWLPTWRPWPGERLQLNLSRPVGLPGPTLTLDRSDLTLTPGRRATQTALEMDLRSSQGGRHRILLPEGAELTALSIDGRPRPLSLQGRALDLPLRPGSQQVRAEWRAPGGLIGRYRPPALDLGTSGVNADTSVQLGSDRWLLWASGPGVGPAVLFWGLLVVLGLFAVLLGRSRLTPLGSVDWLLLGIGLSQVTPWLALLVVLWLFALGLRRRLGSETPRWRFNLAQVGLVLLSIAALLALLVAVQQGLLGRPEMQVAGNGSSATSLHWYLDRQPAETTPVTVVSVSIWVYRGLMLAWALWLAWRLLGWLRWGWQGFAEPELWRTRPQGAAKAAAAAEGLSVEI